MRILALDTATVTGWATWDGVRRDSGMKDFSGDAKRSLGFRFFAFNCWLAAAIDSFDPEVVAYEDTPGFIRNRGAALSMIGYSTRVQEAVAIRNLKPFPVNSRTLKKWLTGNGNADKPTMVSAVNERFGPPFVTDDNEADAIAALEYTRRMLAEL